MKVSHYVCMKKSDANVDEIDKSTSFPLLFSSNLVQENSKNAETKMWRNISRKMQKRFNFSHLRQRFYGKDKDCSRFCQRNVQSVEALSWFMAKTFFNNLFFY